jgi:L-fuculose-phosphate aldolase
MNLPRWSERALRQTIVKVCTALFQKNLVAATDGNVSARVGPDRVLITPSGVSKGDVGDLDIILCDLDGRKIRGRGAISSELHVHLAAYREREDIGGVVHAHPPLATAFTFAGLGHLLSEPVVPEVTAQIGPIPAAPYLTPGSRQLAEAAGALLKKSDVVLLTRHGAVTVGKDPWAAYLRMEKLEYLATILKSGLELHGGRDQIARLDRAETVELLASYGKKPAQPETGAENDSALVETIVQEVLRTLKKDGAN